MLLAVASDDLDGLGLMVERVATEYGESLDFPLLSDPGAAVIGRYGLLNAEHPPGRPIPHPTVYILDRNGVVRWRFVEVDYRVRPSNEEIVQALVEAAAPLD